MELVNPFSPGFGAAPLVVVGRDDLLARFAQFFRTGSGREWCTFLEAVRGSGKTVLLDAIQDQATEHGWTVIQEDAGTSQSDLITRLTDRILTIRDDVRSKPRRRLRKAQVTVLGTGAALEFDGLEQPAVLVTLRGAIESLFRVIGNGLLITLDEIHNSTPAERSDIGNAVQHLARNGARIGLVVAGLPVSLHQGKQEKSTFLSRAWRPEIARVGDDAIAKGLVETAAVAGARFEDRALLAAVVACQGSLYMMQLVGYHAWERSTTTTITLAEVQRSVASSSQEMLGAVTSQIVEALSEIDRTFLLAMVRSGLPTKIADIRCVLDRDSNYVNRYRDRLIKTGVIRSAGHGLVEFAVPGLERGLRIAK